MRGVIAVFGVVIACTLAGCSDAHGDLEASDSPVARYDWDSDAPSMTAALEGTLAVKDGCLVVYPSHGPSTPIVAVFPRQYTSWRAYSKTLSYGGHNFGVGDLIMAGGGASTGLPTDGIPDACGPFIVDDVGVFYIQSESIAPPTA